MGIVERPATVRDIGPLEKIPPVEGDVLGPDSPAHRRVPNVGRASDLTMAGLPEAGIPIADNLPGVHDLNPSVQPAPPAFKNHHFLFPAQKLPGQRDAGRSGSDDTDVGLEGGAVLQFSRV